MPEMTPEYLDELERIAGDEIPNPWTLESLWTWTVHELSKNARQIDSARTALPALVAEVRRLREIIELVRSACPSWTEWAEREVETKDGAK